MNLLNLELEDLATLDGHFSGAIRKALYKIVGQGLEPHLEVIRERGGGSSRWFVVVRGRAGQVTKQEERFEVEHGSRFHVPIGVAVRIHVQCYLEELQDELAAVYREEGDPSREPANANWPTTRSRGRPS